MNYSEIVAAYEADEMEPMVAFELANCGNIIELYELAAREEEYSRHSGFEELLKYVA